MKHFKCNNPNSKFILKNGQEIIFDSCGSFSTENKKIITELEEEIENGNAYLQVVSAPDKSVKVQDAPEGKDFGRSESNTQTHIGTTANMIAALKSNLAK